MSQDSGCRHEKSLVSSRCLTPTIDDAVTETRMNHHCPHSLGIILVERLIPRQGATAKPNPPATSGDVGSGSSAATRISWQRSHSCGIALFILAFSMICSLASRSTPALAAGHQPLPLTKPVWASFCDNRWNRRRDQGESEKCGSSPRRY
jgi:hypothetical protein